mgnify:CR=1 FL=1
MPEMISDSDMPAYLFQLEVDNFGMYHILWQAFSSNAGTPNQYYYIGPTKAAATASRAVSQQVTLSPDISNPILSFLYFAGGLGSTGNSEFVVKLDGSGGEETLFTTKNGSAGWEHHWIDLSAWSNETVTISFELNQSAGDHLAWVYLDEISLGSTYNDVWVAVESVYAGRGETVPIVISYGNRGGATAEDVTISLILSSSLVFVDSDIATTGGSPPTWQIGSLPAKSETQTIVVYVRVKQSAASFTNLTNSVTISTSAAELESGNNLATGTVFTGKYLYLPLATK